jgi:hypothetical protein
MKRKRMKFGEIDLDSEEVYIDKQKRISFFVVEPFSQQRLNFYYFKLAQALEENKNRIVFKTINDEILPYNKLALMDYLKVSRAYFDMIFRVMSHNGVIMQVKVFNIMEYYINPRFVFCGDKIPVFLLNMFRYDVDKLYGEHLIDVRKTLYEKKESNYENYRKKGNRVNSIRK